MPPDRRTGGARETTALTLVGCLEDSGYLTVPTEELAARLWCAGGGAAPQHRTAADALEPAGVGSCGSEPVPVPAAATASEMTAPPPRLLHHLGAGL